MEIVNTTGVSLMGIAIKSFVVETKIANIMPFPRCMTILVKIGAMMMTDNEIVKSFEFCIGDNHSCDGCYFKGKDCIKMDRAILDLINRQRAEIERLNDHFRDVKKMVKTEAIKEFADRLKSEMGCWEFDFNFPSEQETAINLIDNLVKEMVGDDNA